MPDQTRPSRTRPTCSWSNVARGFLDAAAHQFQVQPVATNARMAITYGTAIATAA